MNMSALWDWGSCAPLRNGGSAHDAARTLYQILAAHAHRGVHLDVRYVLAWDELQRRALAESGAVTALVLTSSLLLDALLERLFRTPHVPAFIWPIAGMAIWAAALPLIRKHYEA